MGSSVWRRKGWGSGQNTTASTKEGRAFLLEQGRGVEDGLNKLKPTKSHSVITTRLVNKIHFLGFNEHFRTLGSQ